MAKGEKKEKAPKAPKAEGKKRNRKPLKARLVSQFTGFGKKAVKLIDKTAKIEGMDDLKAGLAGLSDGLVAAINALNALPDDFALKGVGGGRPTVAVGASVIIREKRAADYARVTAGAASGTVKAIDGKVAEVEFNGRVLLLPVGHIQIAPKADAPAADAPAA